MNAVNETDIYIASVGLNVDSEILQSTKVLIDDNAVYSNASNTLTNGGGIYGTNITQESWGTLD